MKEFEYIVNNNSEFLKFLKSKFPLYHDSNVFLRDVHYGVMSYVEERLKKKLRYLEAEQLTLDVAEEFEKQGIFKKVDSKTWLLKYLEFALPRPTPAAKPSVQPSTQAAAQAVK